MLKPMKSLIINEIYSSPNLNELIDNLYVESCHYVYKHIHSEQGKSFFKQTSIAVRDIIKNNFNYDDYASFAITINKLNRERNSNERAYALLNPIELFLLNPEKYNNMALDIAHEILNKIRIRFYDGYTG